MSRSREAEQSGPPTRSREFLLPLPYSMGASPLEVLLMILYFFQSLIPCAMSVYRSFSPHLLKPLLVDTGESDVESSILPARFLWRLHTHDYGSHAFPGSKMLI